MKTRSRLAYWFVVAAAAIILLLRSGSAPLTDPEEARLARVSVEMLRSGDILAPTFEGRPVTDHPPLIHWIQAVLFQSLGIHEFSARLPAVLATVVTVLILGFVARRRFGSEGAAWAAAFYATMPAVLVSGKLGTIEALFSAHVLAAVALDLAEPDETGPYKSTALGALLGLAFLAKGPAGVVLPVILISTGRAASGRAVVPRLRAALSGAGAFGAVVLPWGLAYLRNLGLPEMVEVLRGGASPSEPSEDPFAPPWIHAGVVLLGFLPWVGPLFLGLLRLVGEWRDAAARTALYAAAALLAGLLALAAVGARFWEHILVLAPLAALVITWELGREIAGQRETRLGATLLVSTQALVAVLLAWKASAGTMPEARRVALVGAAAFAVGCFAGLGGMLLQRVRLVFGTAATASLILASCASWWLFPAVAGNHSAEALIRRMPSLQSAGRVILVGATAASVTYYLDRIPERVPAADLEARLGRGGAPFVIVSHADIDVLDSALRGRLREVARSGSYRAYESTGRR